MSDSYVPSNKVNLFHFTCIPSKFRWYKTRGPFRVQFHFIGWECISLGFHVCWSLPNIELHLPFGFVRIGW